MLPTQIVLGGRKAFSHVQMNDWIIVLPDKVQCACKYTCRMCSSQSGETCGWKERA